MVDVAHRRARVAAVTTQAVMIVQQAAVAVPSVVMIAVMIGRQSDVDAQLASQPMMVTAGKRDQPVVVVLKAAIVQTAMVLQDVMIVQTVMSDLAVMIGGMIGQIVTRDQIVTAALKDAMTRPAQRVATNHHLVISQREAASRKAASTQRAPGRLEVVNPRREGPRPRAVMVTQDAHHPPRKSEKAQRGQAAIPHHKAAKAQ